MGSLPNLHELGKDGNNEEVYRPGPALGHLCGGCNAPLSEEEKSKILDRYCGHPKITKARSNPHESHKIVYDDFTLEHMATYSPVSTRSRYNLSGGLSKRRDSMSSSIGATSVRRLLAVVRGGTQGGGIGRIGSAAVYTRKVLIGNLVVICMCHLLSTAVFLPFVALQGSVSIWTEPTPSIPINVNAGSMLLALVYLVAAGGALLAPYVVRRIGSSIVVAICYLAMAAFFTVHIYPILGLTIPACILLGMSIGLLSCAHITFLMTIAHRLCGRVQEDYEESRFLEKTCMVRRVARAFQGAHDFGLILGSVLSAVLITFTINIRTDNFSSVLDNGTVIVDNCYMNTTSNSPHCKNSTQMVLISSSLYDYNTYLDEIFDGTEDGRLCGSQACPINYRIMSNTTSSFRVLPAKSSEVLIGVYTGACVASGFLALFGLDNLKMFLYQDVLERDGLAALRAVKEAFRDSRLIMAAPLAVFIGIEQAFMYADFSKSYVVCTLGIHRLNLVYLSMGLLQSIAACTLSMLLRTIRRYYVVGVGFTFHACLIMVLIVWKPIEDDPALFYVISAAWGVCNSIWEILSFTFLTGLYSDHWEPAFAITSFFKFMGLSIAFVFHGVICNYIKLYLLAFIMFVAVVPFTWLEIWLENLRKVKNMARL